MVNAKKVASQILGSWAQSRQSAKRFSSRWNWDSPTPLAAGECAPPPFGPGGHTRLRLKGWGSPNSNEGTYTVVLYIYKYFVLLSEGLTNIAARRAYSTFLIPYQLGLGLPTVAWNALIDEIAASVTYCRLQTSGQWAHHVHFCPFIVPYRIIFIPSCVSMTPYM